MKAGIQRLFHIIVLWVGMSLQTMALEPGDQAPLLELPRMDNAEIVRLSELRGKIVYVDFWASWCGPCRKSLPLYEAMQKQLPADKFVLLAVNLDEERRDVTAFLKRHPISYPVLMDPDANSARAWSIKAMPSSYLLDAEGKLVNIYIGFEASHIGKIEHDIKTLLAIAPLASVAASATDTDSLR